MFLDSVIVDAKNGQCFALYISSITSLKTLDSRLWPSSRHEHSEATRILDLTLSEEDLLKQMHQKGRYNIKVAEKNGVRIERSTAAAVFADLVKKTAERDGFTSSSARHYEKFLQNVEGSFLLLALHEETVIAGVMGVIWNGMGIYYYGASDYEHRALMAPYLLQWEAMKHCKTKGCTQYDLLGIAPPNAPANHPWQGISGFKEKFGGMIVTYPQEQQLVLRPFIANALRLKRIVLG